MKKVYLKSYLKHNLGDDLFIYIITQRYKNIIFESTSTENYNNFAENLMVKYENIFYKGLKKITKNIISLEKIIMNKSNIILYYGGSIFIENKKKINEFKTNKNKNYYAIGANFGPYKTKEYYNLIKSFLSNTKDVCFRDLYSYKMFKSQPNVRYAPDIVFSYDISKYINNNKTNNAIISVINCDNKEISKYKETYENTIVDIVKKLQTLGYKVTLMSFCKFEGDEETINSICKKISNVSKYFYSNNLEKALIKLGNSDIIVGSRFHANILGLSMNKVVVPIAYSAKTLNALKDINYDGEIIDIRNISNFDVNKLDFNYKFNVDEYKKKSIEHFQKLDLLLGDENNE